MAGLLAWLLNWLALIPWRRSQGEHWTERARVLYPARHGANINLWLIVCIVVLVCLISGLGKEGYWKLYALMAWCGSVVGTYPFGREIYENISFPNWFRQMKAGWLIYFPALTVVIAAFFLMPARFCWETWVIVGLVLIIHLAMMSRLGVLLARFLGICKPPPARLAKIASETSKRLGIPYRDLWLLDINLSFAAALPTTRELLFSGRLLAVHPDNEVAAICVHELSHLNESRFILLRRIIGTMTLYPLMFIQPVTNTWGWAGLIAMFLSVLVLFILTVRLSRRMEVRADQFASENQEQDGTYARALERLYRTNQMPAVIRSRRKTHPDLYDRMIAAGITPDYPRPRPASRFGWTFLVCFLVFYALLVAWGLQKDSRTKHFLAPYPPLSAALPVMECQLTA